MVYAQKPNRSLKLFYDPKTGLYAKARRMRKGNVVDISHNQLKWKEFVALRSRVRDKISLLNLAEDATDIPGLGAHRQSRLYPAWHMYYIRNEIWSI